MQVLHADIVNHLVEGALQERGVDRRDRLHAATRQACGECDCVLLGDSDIEEAVWIRLLKLGQRRPFGHRRRNRHDLRVAPRQFDHRLAKDGGEGRRPIGLLQLTGCRIIGAGAMELGRLGLGKVASLPLSS